MRDVGVTALLCLILATPSAARVLTLDTAVDLALQNNEEMQLADQDKLRAREEIREGWAEALPDIRLTSNYDRSWILPILVFDTPEGRQTFQIGTSNNITTSVRLSQPLYSGGKVGAALRAARSFRDFTDQGYKLSKQSVAARTEIGFYDTILAESLVDVTGEALDLARANLEQVESLRRAGRVSDYDLLRAQVQVSDLLPDSIRAAKNLEVALMNLRNIVGLDQTEEITLSGSFRDQTALDLNDLEALTERGLQARPEIQQAGFEVRIRDAAIQVQKSEMRPSLDLVATGQLAVQSEDFSLSGEDAQESWVTGVALTIPLFDGLKNRALVNKAKVDKRKAGIQVDRLRKQIGLEIRRAWFDVNEARERVAAQAQVVAQADRGERIARSRYGNGFGTQLEVLDAQLVLTRSRTEWVGAKRDHAVSLVRLERAVGLEVEP